MPYFCIYFHYHKMDWNSIMKSDCLDAGILENAYGDIFCWHDIPARALQRIVKYVALEFNVPMVEIAGSRKLFDSKEEDICTVFY